MRRRFHINHTSCFDKRERSECFERSQEWPCALSERVPRHPPGTTNPTSCLSAEASSTPSTTKRDSGEEADILPPRTPLTALRQTMAPWGGHGCLRSFLPNAQARTEKSRRCGCWRCRRRLPEGRQEGGRGTHGLSPGPQPDRGESLSVVLAEAQGLREYLHPTSGKKNNNNKCPFPVLPSSGEPTATYLLNVLPWNGCFRRHTTGWSQGGPGVGMGRGGRGRGGGREGRRGVQVNMREAGESRWTEARAAPPRI